MVKNLMNKTRNLSVMLKLKVGEDVNVAHTEYFVLKYGLQDILDILGENKETENDFEEISESISNTKIIYYTCFLFYDFFKVKVKSLGKDFTCLLGCKQN